MGRCIFSFSANFSNNMMFYSIYKVVFNHHSFHFFHSLEFSKNFFLVFAFKNLSWNLIVIFAFIFFVSIYRMNISQKRPCLKRTWKTLWVCTTHWHPRPRTMRRNQTCLNLKLPTGGSCFFKLSMFCWFLFDFVF